MGRRRGIPRSSRSSLLVLAIVGMLLLIRLNSHHDSTPQDVLGDDGPQLVRRAIDGDTLLLENGQRVRLIGVDTPETKHPDRPVEPIGEQATQFVQALVAGEHLQLEFDRQRLDRYGRLLAYVYLPDGRLLNAELIRAGYSAAETGFSYRQDMKRRFLSAEEAARAARRGIWQAPP